MRKYLPLLILLLITVTALLSCGSSGIVTPDDDIETECTHSWSGQTVIFGGSCTEPSQTRRNCTLCGKTEIISGNINADTHSFGEVTGSKPTSCTEEGFTERTCNDCGYVNRETEGINPNAHSFTITEVPPTCSSEGYITAICDRCGHKETTVTDKSGEMHLFSENFLPYDGGHAKICQLCDEPERIISHLSDKWVADGSEHKKVCSDCGEEYDSGEHQNKHIRVEPTYVERGIEYDECTVCGCVSGSTVLPRLDYKNLDRITCVYGTVISEIALPDGFEFADYDGGALVGNIGTHRYELIFTIDTDDEYFTDTAYVDILVTPKDINISADLSSLSGLVYSGESVPTPTLSDELSRITAIEWYKDGKKLTSAPVNAGKYTLKIICINANYRAETLTREFEIAKAPVGLTDADIRDTVYTGLPVIFAFESEYAAAITFKSESGEIIERPSCVGKYTAIVSVSETENYLSGKIEKQFNITADTVAPTWSCDSTLCVQCDGEYKLEISDMGRVAYFVVTRQSDARGYDDKYIISSQTMYLEMGVTYTVIATDAAGNQSDRLTVYVRPEGSYSPENVYPKNGESISSGTVRLHCDGASEYYLGSSESNLAKVEGIVFGLSKGTYYWYAKCADMQTDVYKFTVTDDNLEFPDELIGYDENAIYTRVPSFVSVTPDGGGILVARHGSDDFAPLHSTTVLEYGVTYDFKAYDGRGRTSDTVTLTYLYSEDMGDGTLKMAGDPVSYSAISHIILCAESPTEISEFMFMRLSADGSSANMYQKSGDVYAADSKYYTFLPILDLSNGDTVYCYAVDINGCRSAVKAIVVDTELPKCGNITVRDGQATISLGTDNLSADYYYRVNTGDWQEYTEEITISAPLGTLIALRAVDAAGNEQIAEHYIESTCPLPEISVISGAIDSASSVPVTLTISPALGEDCYYFINGERYSLNDSVMLLFDTDGTFLVCTAVLSGGNLICSDTVNVIIDTTAPVMPTVLYPAHRFSINGESGRIFLDLSQTVNESGYKLYYKILGLDSEEISLDTPYIPLHSRAIAESGEYTIKIIVYDAAGNRTAKTVTVTLDIDAPVTDGVSIESVIDRENETTDYTVNIDGVTELGGGDCTEIQITVWKKDDYLSGGDCCFELVLTANSGEDISVDLSELADENAYFCKVVLMDDVGNCSVVFEDEFYKYNRATSVEIDGYIFENTGLGYYSLFSYIGNEVELILPPLESGMEYSIGAGFMRGREDIVSVVIPDFVSFIGDNAFAECTSLVRITIGEVTDIGGGAFSGLSSLEHISISHVPLYIGDGAFAAINSHALTLSDGGYYLGFGENAYYMLLGADTEAKTLSIHGQTHIVGKGALAESNITSVTIPGTVEIIGDGAFVNCLSLETVLIETGVKEIPKDCFKNCSDIKSVTIENGLEEIKESAFEGCTSLNVLTIPLSVQFISDRAFALCGMTELYVNSEILTLSYDAFAQCADLELIYYNAGRSECVSGVFADVGTMKDATQLIIGKNVCALPDGLFDGCTGITAVEFEKESICDQIGNRVFARCALSEIYLPESVTKIGNEVFDGCNGLTIISLSDSLCEMGHPGNVPKLQYSICNDRGGEGYYIGNEENPYLVLVRALASGTYTSPESTRILLHGAFRDTDIAVIFVGPSVVFIGAGLNAELMAIEITTKEGWTYNGGLISNDLINNSERLATVMKSGNYPLKKDAQ